MKGGVLKGNMLTPVQMRSLIDFLAMDFFDPKATPDNELSEPGMRGMGLWLNFGGQGQGATLWIHGAGPTSDVDGYMAGFGFYNEQGALKWGVSPPSPAGVP
jgi:hypothetical protein